MPGTLRIRVSAPCGDYISQKAPRRLPAVEVWLHLSQPSQVLPPPRFLSLPSGVSPLGIGPSATPRMAFPELGSGPLRRVGATGPVSAAPRLCHAGDNAGAGSQWVRAGGGQQPGPPSPPRAGGVSEHTPPPSPFEAAPHEPRKHTGVIRG